MKNLTFENGGEIDLRALFTFGCSVKVTDSPIGFFGTGLKFGMAVLLRTGHTVTIQSGGAQHSLQCRRDTMRGKDFDFVFLDEQPLGFTTELGRTWEPWMAYRELYCNAKDETDWSVRCLDAAPEPEAGKTRFIIEGEPLLKAHEARAEFILDSTPMYRLGTLEVHHQPSRNFFYKGIRVMEFRTPSLFTYNETAHVDLTEDRTAKDSGGVIYSISRAILQHGEPPLLEKVLTAKSDHVEHFFDFHGWSGTTPGRDFFPTVAALQRDGLANVNGSALRLWREKGAGFISPRRVNPSRVQSVMMERAITFCERIGFPLRDEYPILIVESLGSPEVLAMADLTGKQILLALHLFDANGTKGVARALAEEYLHLKHGMRDETRQMQNFIFDKMLSLGEELAGEPL
jgi:hypothetical protein